MTDILGSSDCGNSPKNRFAQDLAISIETGVIESGYLSVNIVWQGARNTPIEGRNAVQKELADRQKPAAIVIDRAISHGKVGAVSGELTFADGEMRRFSHVFEFTTAKANCVAVIKSYA
jgi:hypothetical protein